MPSRPERRMRVKSAWAGEVLYCNLRVIWEIFQKKVKTMENFQIADQAWKILEEETG